MKADETSILFKWERGNPKQLGSAIGVVLHVDDSGDFEGVWEKVLYFSLFYSFFSICVNSFCSSVG